MRSSRRTSWVGDHPDDRLPRSRGARVMGALLVVAVVALVVVVFVQARLSGAVVPDLDVRFVGAEATPSGALVADVVLENDSRFDVEVVRVVVHSEALGPSDIDVVYDGVPVRLPHEVAGGDELALHMTFDSFDCAQVDDPPAIEVRATPLVPIGMKRAFDVGGVDEAGWLVAATRDVCG